MDRRNFCKLGATGLGALALSSQASALEKVVSSPAKKWAIVYGSQCGTTKKYADAINEGLGGIATVVDIATTTPKISDYEFFIIGGWRNATAVKPDSIPNFIKNNKTTLQNKIKGLFVVLGNNGIVEITPEMKTFLKSTLITPAAIDENRGKIFFGDSPVCASYPDKYKNFNKDDGIAFGKKILSENQTGIFHFPSELNREIALSCCSGFTGRSTIKYSIPIAGHVELSICSIHGQKLATLVSQHQNAGSYRVPLGGKCVTPGHYIYRLEAGDLVKTISAAIIQ
jgi:hypothetical protein